MKRIILTGGGTAGHVMPNLALLPRLRELGYDILYVGSKNGMEKGMAADAGLKYSSISTGKLRRYFDLKNFTDPFRVIKGFFDALRIMDDFKPDAVFSKGGFVAVPVAAAAGLKHIPVIAHESDMTPGLANRISAPFARYICCTFPETVSMLPEKKAVLSGSPIRAELLTGDRKRGLETLGFTGEKDVLMIIGGSLGAKHVNETVREALPELLNYYDIVHLCGKGNLDAAFSDTPGYRQFEFVKAELPDYFAAADLCISRAGANAICELLALRKPALLVPLPKGQSRGDQILNAESFEKQGFSHVLKDEELSAERLLAELAALKSESAKLIAAMERSEQSRAIDIICGLIEEVSGGTR